MQEKVILEWKRLRERCSVIAQPFFVLFIIYLIGFSAIIRANFNYVDDMGRVARGYTGWENSSRYISCFLSQFIHGDSYLTDVSPLTQFLAIMMLALASSIVLYLLSEQEKFNLWQLIGVIPLGMSPYFLECISYKFDSPYMALSILAGVAPLLLRKKKSLLYGGFSVFAILVVCMTYQSATGIFPMLVILLCVKEWNQRKSSKELGSFIVTSVISYGVGLIIYKVFIMNKVADYVSADVPGIKELIPVTIRNMYKYFCYIKTDFKVEWLTLVVAVVIGYVWVSVRDSQRNRYVATVVAIVSALVMLCLCFGIYPIMEKPSFQPRAMYGFGVYLAFLGVTITSKVKAYLGKISCLLLSWAFFVFSFTYGNALVVQSTYTDFRISMVMDDLSDLEIFKTDETKNVQISGTIGYSKIINNMPQDYGMLKRLVPVTFRETWMWGAEGFLYYYGMENVVRDTNIDLTTYDLPVVKDTMYHTIRTDDNYVLIELK